MFMELDNRFLSDGTYVLLLHLKKMTNLKKELCDAPHLDMFFRTRKKN